MEVRRSLGAWSLSLGLEDLKALELKSAGCHGTGKVYGFPRSYSS